MPASSDIYGTRVGQIPLPDPYDDLSRIIPGLPGLNAAGGAAILNKLKGQLSPETLAMMQNHQASTAARSGMPGANVIPGSLNYNRSLRDIGRTVEDTQSKGVSELLPFLQTLSSTQTVNPALQYERNLQNALNIASPEPAAAGGHAEELFNKYLEMLTNPGGPGGGTRGQVGMPTYSYGPKPTAGPSNVPGAGRAISGGTGYESASRSGPGQYFGTKADYNRPAASLFDDPRFTSGGFSGSLPGPQAGGGFFAGDYGDYDPLTGLPISSGGPLGASELPTQGTGEAWPLGFNPLDWLGIWP